MKNIILALLLITLLILPGCNDTDDIPAVEPDVNTQEIIQEDEHQLSEIDGWWHLNQDYEDNYAGVQIFSVDSYSETALSRDKFGNLGMEFDVRMENGQFVMVNDLFGDVYFNIIDVNTIEIEETGDVFYRIDPLDSTAELNLDGKWNFKGQTGEDIEKVIYFDGTNFKYATVQFEQEFVSNEGTWSLGNSEMNFFVGNPVNYLAVNTDADLSFRLSQDQLVLMGGFWDDDYFLREDAIGTPEGDAALLKVKLSAGSSWMSDKSILYFVGNGTLLRLNVESYDNHAWSGDDYAGTWETDGTTLILKWEDGTEDYTSIIENSFEVESLQETFVQ
ncbi:hypothetical protein [Sedimentibacter sp.]|uniref:hypothetical protein n=1 Tax=Sedimentibacter sp. TaxID=1960295 RepID=UPI0028985E99|nr:hypothetical protein [Sedimentibacter sp.]